MQARVTLLEIDLLRADVDDVLDRYREEVLPDVQAQPGYEGVAVLVSETGAGLVMTLWSDPGALRQSHPVASETVERFTTVFRASPGRESYEVRLLELPTHAVG